MSRFTKAAVIEQLQLRADGYQKASGFDLSNGVSQLLPKGADDKMKALINRAVSYGHLRALEDAARDIENGCLGVCGK